MLPPTRWCRGGKQNNNDSKVERLPEFKFGELSGEGENVRSRAFQLCHIFFWVCKEFVHSKDRPFLAVLWFLVASKLDLLPAFVSTKSNSAKVGRQECISSLFSLRLNLRLLTKQHAVLWYHHYLQHPGHTHPEEMMNSAIYWKDMHSHPVNNKVLQILLNKQETECQIWAPTT